GRPVVVRDAEELLVGGNPGSKILPFQLVGHDLRHRIFRRLIQPGDHLVAGAARIGLRQVAGAKNGQPGERRAALDDELPARKLDDGVGKDELLSAVWHGRTVSESPLGSRINAARSAIGDSGERQLLIRTVARRGLRFVGEVTEALVELQNLEAAAHSASDDRPTIAVLPFANMSDDPTQDYFSDGITEDIITDLSRWQQLAVRSRSASFRYRGAAADLGRMARELNVRYIVEGSVQRRGERIRISAQLIDTETGSHVWADRFDRPDLFKVL